MASTGDLSELSLKIGAKMAETEGLGASGSGCSGKQNGQQEGRNREQARIAHNANITQAHVLEDERT